MWRTPPEKQPEDLNGNERNANIRTESRLEDWDAYAKLKDGDRIGVRLLLVLVTLGSKRYTSVYLIKYIRLMLVFLL